MNDGDGWVGKWVSDCFKKARYPSESKARRYAERAMKARGGQIRTYYCGKCLGFHLTSQPERQTRPYEARKEIE